MKRPIASLVVACLTVASLAACTKVSTETGGAGGNSWTIHGVLRWANNAEPDNLNPVIGNQQVEVDLSMFWAGYLLNWTDDGKFIGELATEEPTLKNGGISADGLSFTYHLRKGVLWQDGKPFTADDVIFTYQAIMNKDNNVSSRVGYDLITGIDKKDDHTIVVHIKQKWAPFVASFFTMSGTPFPILPKHLLGQLPNINHADYNNKPIGTGPFQIVSYEKGSLIKFVANPHYWRGAPKLKEIDYHIIPDENTLLTQMKTHEIDFQYNASAAHYPELQQIQGVQLYKTPFTQYGQLGFNTKVPALSDKRVRQALAYATDTQELIHDVSHDLYVKGDSDQPAFLWAHNAHVKQYPYDVAMAGKLLDQAGWTMGSDGYRSKNGKRLTISITGSTGRKDAEKIELLVQNQWKKVGVDLTVKNYIPPQLFASYGAGGILQRDKFEVGNYSWVNGVDPDNSTLWMCDQFPPNGQNTYQICDPELDAQEKIALTEYDPVKRKAAYDKIQDILADQEPMIVIWYVSRLDAANSDFKGYKPAHAVTTFWNPWEYSI
ncbi:MAG TPA: peptide ABC transporter substrate-binding protein [Candidatus Tumulicola sp.]|nr:peptide ABC transporter substrate-binding protein [Candidatus Tumulicola sp.]